MASTSSETFTVSDGRALSVRRARRADDGAVAALLRELGLPTDGVADWLEQFWVAEHQDQVVGVAGIERYGGSGLLRSVAVARAWQGSGIGRALVDRVLDNSRAAGIRDVYLLTTTAERYFPRLGFERIDRDAVPEGVRTSVEFRETCPASATVMRKDLTR